MARQLLTRVNYLRMRSMAEPHRLEDGIQEWDRLIEAIVARNPAAAAKAMAEHLGNARRAVVAKLELEEQQPAVVPVRVVRRSG
jgi:DNA-binding GntR family transcriptional regulator